MMSNNKVLLSRGSLQKILDGVPVESATLQVLGYKRVPVEGAERFRLLLFDGITLFSFAILATQINNLIIDKKLEKYSVFKLNKYAVTEVESDKKIILCLDIIPLIPGCQINRQVDYLNQDVGGSSDANHSIKSRLNVEVVPTKQNQNRPATLKDTDQRNMGSPLEQHPSISTNSLFSPSTPNSNMSSNINSFSNYCLVKNNNLTEKGNWGKKSEAVSPLNDKPSKSVIPIASLTPYLNRWTIKARLIYKTHVISYSKDKKNGKLFCFNLLDASGEIRAISFDKQAEDLNQTLQLNKVYLLSNAIVRLPKIDSPIHDFELNISDHSKIELIPQADLDIPELKFNFTLIGQIAEANQSYVDVIGLCVNSDLKNIVIKATNKEVQKLDLYLIDMDKNQIIVSIWGNESKYFCFDNHPVVALKRAKVTNFNGCSLSVTSASMVFVNPSLTQAYLLQSWFNEHHGSLQLDTLAFKRNVELKTIADINDLVNSDPNVTDYSIVKAVIVMVQKDNAMYRACPSSDCFKKVAITPTGLFHCNKCNKDYDNFSWTLMLKINLADFSSDIWTVAFNETAESILNMKTSDLSLLKEQDEDKFQEVISSLCFKSFKFKLRSRIEYFNDTTRLKTYILDFEPISSISYTRNLLTNIERLEKILMTDK